MAARAMAAQSGNATDDAGAGEDHEHLGLARKFLLGRPSISSTVCVASTMLNLYRLSSQRGEHFQPE